ncbi:hypothetical protein RA263_08350 [Pseudomonas syringae pv. tagetis]|uniref:Uncharacterized protein n=1 Tax=Pseudomonas syringae pv. tagetis TaxID=129140 RepID=A0ABW7NMI2_9PSED|nr:MULTISPECIES: hypothetical protein [Pseudomonas syringae group]UNB66362.1 hypothetical protein MME58_13985 [Pseudomonas syringae pv. tagetis]
MAMALCKIINVLHRFNLTSGEWTAEVQVRRATVGCLYRVITLFKNKRRSVLNTLSLGAENGGAGRVCRVNGLKQWFITNAAAYHSFYCAS